MVYNDLEEAYIYGYYTHKQGGDYVATGENSQLLAIYVGGELVFEAATAALGLGLGLSAALALSLTTF